MAVARRDGAKTNGERSKGMTSKILIRKVILIAILFFVSGVLLGLTRVVNESFWGYLFMAIALGMMAGIMNTFEFIEIARESDLIRPNISSNDSGSTWPNSTQEVDTCKAKQGKDAPIMTDIKSLKENIEWAAEKGHLQAHPIEYKLKVQLTIAEKLETIAEKLDTLGELMRLRP